MKQEYQRKAHILVVCTANVCRSPVAEALLRDRLQKEGYGDWTVSSAGTWAYPGQKATSHSISLMAEQGLDITGHASRTVDEAIVAAADLILCMETGHVEALRAEFDQHAERIHLLAEMSARHDSVGDPVGGPRELYEQMVLTMTELIESGLPCIIKLAANKRNGR